MLFFDLSRQKEEQQTTTLKLANRYLIEVDEYCILWNMPERSYKITDMDKGKEFKLNISYDIFRASQLEKEETSHYNIKDNHCKVFVSVTTAENEEQLASFSSEIFQKDFDINEKRISVRDVDLDIYNQLKEARKDASNPRRQEEAYLVSTLLRAAHDDIWIAPLLKHKDQPEYSAKLEQIKGDVEKAMEEVKEKTCAYKKKRKEEQEYEEAAEEFPFIVKKKPEKKKLSAEQMQQQNSLYIQSLMKENLADGL